MEMTRLAPRSSMNRSPQRMLRRKNLETRWATGLNSRYRERKHRLSSCLYLRLPLPLPPLFPSLFFPFFPLSSSLFVAYARILSHARLQLVQSARKQCSTVTIVVVIAVMGLLFPQIFICFPRTDTRARSPRSLRLNWFGSESSLLTIVCFIEVRMIRRSPT